MNDYCLLIDGGTTNTRFTLVCGDRVVERSQRRIGATDADQELNNDKLGITVAKEISSMEERLGISIGRICCSGMIASGNGLVNIPHISAPADVERLARSVQQVLLPEVSRKVPLECIPGVKCEGNDILCSDMMRGEETEIAGLLTPEDANKRLLVIHFGSHNKIVEVNKNAIVRSATTLSGELFYAITRHTILRSAVARLNEMILDEAYVRMGFDTCLREGMSRALFATRLHQVIGGAGMDQCLSFLLGILAQQDHMAFSRFFEGQIDELILYGRDSFAQAYMICVKDQLGGIPIRRIDYAQSQRLSVEGMQRILAVRSELENVVYG